MGIKGLISDVVAVLFLGYAAGAIVLSIIADEFSGLIVRSRKGRRENGP